LRTCEAGSGLIEYSLLLAVVALALVGVLKVFRNTVGSLTNRTAVTVSQQTARGYGSGGTVSWTPSGTPAAQNPATPEPDRASAQPDSSSGAVRAAAAFRLAIP
jgi:Flp pilus assembly pilin Flp